MATAFFGLCHDPEKNRTKFSKCCSCVVCIDEVLASSDWQFVGPQVEERD